MIRLTSTLPALQVFCTSRRTHSILFSLDLADLFPPASHIIRRHISTLFATFKSFVAITIWIIFTPSTLTANVARCLARHTISTRERIPTTAPAIWPPKHSFNNERIHKPQISLINMASPLPSSFASAAAGNNSHTSGGRWNDSSTGGDW